MNFIKIITSLGLTISILAVYPLSAFADTAPPDGYEHSAWEALNDTQLEYHEISDRIVYFSDTYRSYQYNMSKNYSAIEHALDGLDEMLESSRSDLRDAKKEGDAAETIYNNTMIVYGEETQKNLKKTLKVIKGSTDRVLNTTIKSALVSSTQDLMITYWRLESALELLETSAGLTQAAYDSALTQQSLGMATAHDVLSARQDLQAIQTELLTARYQTDQIKQNLCMLTGWDYDAQIGIGAIPEPEQNRIAEMDPQTDMDKAIGNNYTLSELRRTSVSGALEKRSRLEKMDEMEELIKVRLNQAYTHVLETQSAYQAAGSAYESAELNYQAAHRQHQLGIVSDLQYQQLTAGWLSQKMGYENAKLDLVQAMEAYEWGVKGQLGLD